MTLGAATCSGRHDIDRGTHGVGNGTGLAGDMSAVVPAIAAKYGRPPLALHPPLPAGRTEGTPFLRMRRPQARLDQESRGPADQPC